MPINQVVVKAVAATAAITVILAGILFYFFYRFVTARQRQRKEEISSIRRETTPAVGVHEEFEQRGGTLRGLIVDENGRDVLYLRKFDGGRFTSCFSKVWSNPIIEDEKRVDDRGDKPGICSPIQELPLLQEPCHAIHFAEGEKPAQVINNPGPINSEERVASKQSSGDSQYAPPQPTPIAIPPKQTTPPPPPLAQKAELLPQPPPPPPPLPKGPKPVPVQIPSKIKPGPPAPPPKTSGLSSAVKPPIPPRGKASSNSRTESSIPENSDDRGEIQKKLKPLHWDKVVTSVDHSIVWNEINDGSFRYVETARFDNELMEDLFGYTTPNQKSSEVRNISKSSVTSSPAPPTQIFILDPRKSQNTAIILKSLAISRKEILDAIQEGHGLCADTLEKLTKISPSTEETAKILQFDGNPTKLADADSFLYFILKAIPSAFIRINAMLFRSSYDPEILQVKESLQTLELSCKELRTRGIFLKLLEAILKAGNKMNAGTARGNAQGFNLSALRKLSYVKSTDGKTTLLHFVVEQVIRSEGKRCVNDRNHILGRSKSTTSKDDDRHSDSKTAREERDREYLMLGIPVVGGLSTEFSNVKKAATIDYNNFISLCPTLTIRVNDIRQLVIQCSSSERSGFVREMKGFLEESEEELKVVREEQTRVMQLVKRTTEYYQAGASKDRGTDPLQLFVIVKEFLDMVDQVCINISMKLQKRNVATAGSTPTPPLSPLSSSLTTPVRFQNLQTYFVTEKTGSLSSESDDDF